MDSSSESVAKVNQEKIGEITLFPDKPLGSGNSGQVFFGDFKGVQVAVKRIKDTECKVKRAWENRLLEFSNKNVIRYLACSQSLNYTYVAMELCDASLDDVITRKYKAPCSAPMEELLRQAATGLQYLHSRRIAHRNIVPRSILIAIAKTGDGGSETVVKLASLLRHARGVDMCALGWVAPEWRGPKTHANDSRFTSEMDVFSLGCVFGYALAGGRHPYGDDHSTREMNSIIGTYVKENLNAITNVELRETILKMVHPSPRIRPTIVPVVKQLDHYKDWRTTKTTGPDETNADTTGANATTPAGARVVDETIAHVTKFTVKSTVVKSPFDSVMAYPSVVWRKANKTPPVLFNCGERLFFLLVLFDTLRLMLPWSELPTLAFILTSPAVPLFAFSKIIVYLVLRGSLDEWLAPVLRYIAAVPYALICQRKVLAKTEELPVFEYLTPSNVYWLLAVRRAINSAVDSAVDSDIGAPLALFVLDATTKMTLLVAFVLYLCLLLFAVQCLVCRMLTRYFELASAAETTECEHFYHEPGFLRLLENELHCPYCDVRLPPLRPAAADQVAN